MGNIWLYQSCYSEVDVFTGPTIYGQYQNNTVIMTLNQSHLLLESWDLYPHMSGTHRIGTWQLGTNVKAIFHERVYVNLEVVKTNKQNSS